MRFASRGRQDTAARCLSLTLLSLTLAAGCNSGSRRSANQAAAPTTSAATTTSTTTTAPPLPTPGGQIATLTSAAAVQATLGLGVHRDFLPRCATSDLVTPDLPGLRDRAFALEEPGVVRVLDLSGTTIRPQRTIELAATRLAAGQAMGALSLQDEHTALAVSSGLGAEAIWLFDPTTAMGPNDVQRMDVGQVTVTWPAGTQNSAGADIGGQPRPVSFVSGAALAGGRLWFSSSNFDANFDLDPGTVFAYDWDPVTRRPSGGMVLRTTSFNPTGITRLVTPKGELLLVTSSGLYAAGPSSVDVIDPRAPALVGHIDLGAVNVSGRVRVSPDGKRGYLGSQSTADVHVLDLNGLGDLIGQPGNADLSARHLGAWSLPAPAGAHYVSSLALSHTGNYLYAVDFNESALYVVDLAAPGLATVVRGFARSGVPANYEGLASLVTVRAGVPGVDFQGPSILVATINLAAADQSTPDVKVALDAVTVSRH